MSDQLSDHVYFHDPFHDHHRFFTSNSSTIAADPSADPSSLYTDCFQGSTDYDTLANTFGMSPSNFVQADSTTLNDQKVKLESGEAPVTPNSSMVLSSSTEAGDDEDANNSKKLEKKGISEDGGVSSKKVSKPKKGEKKEKEPIFAFMTKSEIDNLEDGYRWRKYGQKAVKNSPYPRSYYRCTTLKCTVKKRVERSFQDPTTVITTYEGTHNHHLPSTLRGYIGGIFPHSILNHENQLGRPGFPHHLVQMSPMNQLIFNYGTGDGSGLLNSSMHQQQQQQNHMHKYPHLQLSDYGLLQDIVPSMEGFKQEP
ncbi:WRKY transcription factor 71-like isoform X1 [Apium graveolens]|uniref:WRKY transcription factor 71-like isoform X1 n=1 Tax=Apium graveolens TaxID=4045 RepID=UPI003D7B4C16